MDATIALICPLDDSCTDVDSIPTVSSPSNRIVASHATKYDIFLSFRGEDTRDTFSSYLYEALCNASIHTFMDHKLPKGDDISPILLETIKESKISLIIFSKDYASSMWCMDELVHIMKCKDQYGRTVIPIFCNVDPSNVRKQNGSFGDGFAKLKQRFKHDQERVQEWKNALERSTNLSGWDSKNIRPEPKLIKMIVKDILSKLHNKSSFHLEGLVGIDYHIQKVEGLLSEARIVGIWGMGGIGKTTLAKAVFDRLTAQFESFYFAKDVRRQVERSGLDELQEKCFKQLFKDEDINTYNLGSTFVKERLHRKKVLLVLDDVDNVIAIEDLIKACAWFGEGSRIIITSRDEQVLKNSFALKTYRVPQLNPREAFHLFCLKAFKQNEPSKRYLELSKWVVDYCEGNPLALTVLGYFLQDRGKEEWESAIRKLNQILDKHIFNVIKLSFDGLDDTQRIVFLDLAFFLNEAWRISLEDCTRRLYDTSAHIDISVLKERSLISVNEYGYIEMHALLMEMGLEISRPPSISNPEKPIRLWKHQDIYHVFNDDKGIETIRCMSLDASKIKKITLRASDFQKMCGLIFLKVYKSDRKEPSKLNFRGDLDYLSEELMFFSWEEYPLSYVPLHFCAENLTALTMCDSNIRQLWEGNQYFPNLEEVNLWHSKHLIALPDLSQTPKIKRLNLDGCVNLSQIHSSTFLGERVDLGITDCGPMQIKLGGNIKGRSSGVMTVRSYLDLHRLSFYKVTMKVYVCGNMIYGVRFKHEVLPLKEIEELRKEAQSLGSLLPFVGEVGWFRDPIERKVECFEGPIEFGHDLSQHYDFNYTHAFGQMGRVTMGSIEREKDVRKRLMNMRIDKKRRMNDDMEDYDFKKRRMNDDMEDYDSSDVDEEESSDDEEDSVDENESSDDEERGSDREEMMNGHQVVTTSLMEGDEGDNVLMEHCCSESVTFTRVPNSITRWSLLMELTLPVKSLPLYNNYCGRTKPLLDVTLSFPDIMTWTDLDILYNGFDLSQQSSLHLWGWFQYLGRGMVELEAYV
ncbi:hypothetical protein K1719_001713 [Acacia pycnantha]|nr:hypothetical protein K1719_001713 [Acacia pycnantha]